MYISKVQRRLTEIVNHYPEMSDILDFVVSHGANREEMRDAYHVALWLEGAPKKVKEEFIDLVDWFYGDTGIRICTNCGKFMVEGYILPDYDYACSEECAIKNYVRDVYNADSEDHKITREQAETMFHYDLENCDDDCYWTEWELSA